MKLFSISALAVGIVAAFTAFAGEDAKKAPEVKKPFFGNATCPASGEKVDQSMFLEKDGQKVYFCCPKCKAGAVKDVAAAIDKAYPKDKAVDVKNKTCPVMGDELEKDAKSVTIQGHTIGLCCSKCIAKLQKAPDHYLTLLTDPSVVPANNKECPVSGKAVDRAHCLVIDGVLVDFCCEDCVTKTQKEASVAESVAKKLDLAKLKADAKKKS